jgi:hypothetical protein
MSYCPWELLVMQSAAGCCMVWRCAAGAAVQVQELSSVVEGAAGAAVQVQKMLQVAIQLLSRRGVCCRCCCPSAGAVWRGGRCCRCCCPTLENYMCCCLGRREMLLCRFLGRAAAQLGERRNGTTKIREMDKLLDFQDDPTTKIKTAISFFMYLQIG